MNKVYEERIDNKYRYFVGEETKDKDGIIEPSEEYKQLFEEIVGLKL